jgi:hypothetical protein
MHGSQQFGDLVLHRIGILVLIYQMYLNLRWYLCSTSGMVFQQFVHFQQQVIKIHRAVLKTAVNIGFIDLAMAGRLARVSSCCI